MKLHEAIGLELERREKCASRQHCEKAELQARIEALEAAATDVVECGVDAMAYDRRQVLDALAALLQETDHETTRSHRAGAGAEGEVRKQAAL